MQASAVPGLLRVTAPRGMDWSVQWKMDISMNVKFKKLTKKSIQQNEGHLPLVLHSTNQKNKHLYSILFSPTDCIWTHSPQHPDKPALIQHTNIMRLKPKKHLRIKWHVQWAPNFIVQGLNSQQQLFEKNKSTKLNLDWKINKIKNEFQLSFVKIGGFSSNLQNR